MARTSKDLAKRLRLHRYPLPDVFRRHYWKAGTALALGGVVAWAGLHFTVGRRQYLPGPLSQNHATFGDRCEKCHDQFHAVSNAACLVCHTERVHADNETRTPACASCHVEHRGTDVFLAVSGTACVECHAALQTKGRAPAVQTHIDSFAAHPAFVPLRDGRKDHDTAQIRFNHKVHLTSTQMPAEERPLRCVKCHVPAADGRLMQPIAFEAHCRRCHKQEVMGPAYEIEAVHKDPATVREDLRIQLLDAAAALGASLREDLRRQLQDIAVPDPQLLFPAELPGRKRRQEFDRSRLRVTALEADLYQPLRTPEIASDAPSQSLYDLNRHCFLCHFEDGTHAPSELPKIAATRSPSRWLERGEFSHQRHAQVRCNECHGDMQQSSLTSDTNLPDQKVCQRCHADSVRQSAGTNCVLCHLYHDTSKARRHPPGTAGAEESPAARQVGITCLSGGDCPTQ